jgi:hypothetical protein
MWCGVVNRATDKLESFIPGASDETGFFVPANHRMGQPAEGLELLWAEPSQSIQVSRSRQIECRHRVQPKCFEPAHAEVNAVNDTVTESIGS